MRNVASGWLYSANILAMHGPMNVKNYLHRLVKSHVSTIYLILSLPVVPFILVGK